MASYPDLGLYIAGEWRSSSDTLAVLNPANEHEIGRLPIASSAALDDALDAAEAGFEIWSATAPRDRANVLVGAAALLRERIDEVAYAITLENGKPLAGARAEVIRGAEFLEWDAGEAVRTYGRIIPSTPGVSYTVHHQPIGIVTSYTPWNFPMSQPARKIAGAIASGCSLILKPAEETPAGAIYIAQALADAGLPAGVLNLVYGIPADISSYLIPDPRTRLVAFTGSTGVGRHLTTLASEYMTPVLMELGGHAPVIVCEDTDVAAAAASSAIRAMRNSGQVCTSPTRFFVAEQVFDEFLDVMTTGVAAIKVGDGLEPGVEMGPLANDRRIAAMTGLVDDAIDAGATVTVGANALDRPGYFFEPTILANVSDSARIMHEEPFGPVAVVNPVGSLDEAIDQANSVPYGLAGYGFTNRHDYAQAMVDRVEVGNLSINTLEASLPETPFGGIKHSGYGREGGSEGLDHYLVVKNVSHSINVV